MTYFETSCKTGENVQDFFEQIASDLVRRQHPKLVRISISVIESTRSRLQLESHMPVIDNFAFNYHAPPTMDHRLSEKLRQMHHEEKKKSTKKKKSKYASSASFDTGKNSSRLRMHRFLICCNPRTTTATMDWMKLIHLLKCPWVIHFYVHSSVALSLDDRVKYSIQQRADGLFDRTVLSQVAFFKVLGRTDRRFWWCDTNWLSCWCEALTWRRHSPTSSLFPTEKETAIWNTQPRPLIGLFLSSTSAKCVNVYVERRCDRFLFAFFIIYPWLINIFFAFNVKSVVEILRNHSVESDSERHCMHSEVDLLDLDCY